MTEKTHFRKAFNSPYLSSADIVEPTVLTIARVALEIDKTNKTKDLFNTAYFAEKEIRPGEALKPMILNATNSKMIKDLTGSPFIDDWMDFRVLVYVDSNVKFGLETLEGLRLSSPPARAVITPDNKQRWNNAKAAYIRDGNLDNVRIRADISQAHAKQLKKECAADA